MSTITQPRRSVNAKSRPLTVTLTMEINGTAYRVEPIGRAPGGLKSFRLAKTSGDGAVYDVDAHADRIVCTCPSYTKTHEGTSSLCKHGRALIMVGLVDYPPVQAAPAFVHVPDEFDEPTSPAPYDGHLAKLAAIAEAEATVRAEAERGVAGVNTPPVVKAPIHPTTYDPQWQAALAAVAKGEAIWIDHRHRHTSEPLSAPKMTVGTTDSHSEPRLIDDDGTPLETPAEMDERHRAEHAALVAEVLEGRPSLPACCPDDEALPCRACLTHDGPSDLSDDGWDDSHVWAPTDFAPDPEDEPFASWLDRQAEAFTAIGSPRAKWLAGKIAKLAEQALWLDAADPDAFDDRLDAHLDCVRAEAEARHAARCR